MRRRLHPGFTLVELMIVVAIIGILAALAIPNFIKYQARSKQGEAKSSLRAYFMAQRHHFSENDTFTSDLGALGFAPERGNRYGYKSAVAPTVWQARSGPNIFALANYTGIEADCYKIGVGCVPQPARPATLGSFTLAYEGGMAGPTDTGVVTGSNGSFVMEALGNVDNDDVNDVFLISSGTVVVAPGPCTDGERGVPGVMVSIYNDVSCP